ncbi:MAG: Rrf2 family transcriptional regulator [Actinomycetota bacterium]|jgi:Rrf2 family protein|nr:Rrf2 family transcriptional regulator [Actinomycetota bacterium]
MQVSARADYALRAASELAKAKIEETGPLKGEKIAAAQGIPKKFMENILLDLKHHGLVRTQRGASGGYWLAMPADEISLADVIRVVEGPLANVRGEWPEAVEYTGAAEKLREVWIAVRANLRAVLETVTLADLVEGSLPPVVEGLTRSPEAWVHH